MGRKAKLFSRTILIYLLVFILVDFVIFLGYLIFYSFKKPRKPDLTYDFLGTYRVVSELELPLIVFDSMLLSFRSEIQHNFIYEKPIVFALDSTEFESSGLIEKIESMVTSFENAKDPSFRVTVFYNNQIFPSSRIPVSIVWKRFQTFQCIVLHPFVENTWWFGSLINDPDSSKKLHNLGISENDIEMRHEGIMNKLEIIFRPIHGSDIYAIVPKNSTKFFKEVSESKFLPCNTSRANYFRNKFYGNSTAGQKFKHRAWKLLAKAKRILDRLSIKFWLSSGTFLGYFRECDFIPHSVDVDIGIFAQDFTSDIISEMESHGLALKHWFGNVKDSLELSFIDKSGLKLDIFFFYDDGNFYWNGGTQAKTGRKFKYVFPRFTLCWTVFRELKIRIPCDGYSYINANYGPTWYVPIKHWDWKTSPSNVIPNGIWPKTQWAEVIKLFS